MESDILKLVLEHASPVVLAVMACIYLARQVALKDKIIEKKDEELRVLVDRYTSKFERLADIQQETLRMQAQSVAVVQDASTEVAGLRRQLEEIIK